MANDILNDIELSLKQVELIKKFTNIPELLTNSNISDKATEYKEWREIYNTLLAKLIRESKCLIRDSILNEMKKSYGTHMNLKNSELVNDGILFNYKAFLDRTSKLPWKEKYSSTPISVEDDKYNFYLLSKYFAGATADAECIFGLFTIPKSCHVNSIKVIIALDFKYNNIIVTYSNSKTMLVCPIEDGSLMKNPYTLYKKVNNDI